MKALILVTLLIASSFAVQMQEQATMEASGAADTLLDHLNKIETSLRNEEIEHQTLFNHENQECQDEFTARNQAIADGKDAFQRSDAQHSRCVFSLNSAHTDLNQAREYIAQIEQELAERKQTRENQAAEFQALIHNEIEPAIYAVQSAFPIIDEFANGGTSFAQIAKNMGTTFRAVVKSGNGANMALPLTALLALRNTNEFSASEIAEVKNLFQNLLRDLESSRDAAIKTEQTRIEEYKAKVAQLTPVLEGLRATEQRLITYVDQMQTCVAQEEAISNQADSKVRNNQAALDKAIAMCQAFTDQFNNASHGRNSEIQLLETLKEFIREQASIFGDYGAEKSNAFDDYRKQYESGLNSQVSMFIQLRNENKNKRDANIQQALQSRKSNKA